jgi:predicted permease
VLSDLYIRVRSIFRRSTVEHELHEELRFHMEHHVEKYIKAGLPREEAARRARLEFGGFDQVKQTCREARGVTLVDTFLQDVRYALRGFSRSRGFTAVATLSLALAIGSNATIFSVAKQLLYERLAVPRPQELRLLAWTGTEEHVAVHSVWGDYRPLPGGRVTSTAFSYMAFQKLGAENSVLEDLFAFNRESMNATINGVAQRVRGEMVSGNYYAALGVSTILGRGISPADDQSPGRGAVAVIGYGLWERAFGKSPAVLGRVIRVNDTALTIVGVNPKGFTSAKDVQTPADVFMPITMQPLVSPQPGLKQPLFDPDLWWVNIMGRSRHSVNDVQAQTALDTQLRAIVRGSMPVKEGEDLPRVDLRDGSRGLFEERGTFLRPMTVLMTLVGFVLLLACANVANLMLARGARRNREMSVRVALGASRIRILRQMLVESMLLAAMGGAGGLAAGYFGRNALPRMIEQSWEQSEIHVHFDWRVFAFTAAVTVLTGILFGLAPALAATRFNVNQSLKQAAQTATRRSKGVGSRVLVGFQVAVSTLLVVGAGLFFRTLAGLSGTDVGFRTDDLLLIEINPARTEYPPGKDVELHERIQRAFAGLPGVAAVTVAGVPYIADTRWRTDFVPEGRQSSRDEAEFFNVVGNNFFEAMGIPIVSGRPFGARDTRDSMPVGIINRVLARKYYPDRNAIGQRFSIKDLESDGHETRHWVQIVGICADTHYDGLREEPPPQFFTSVVQRKQVGAMTFEIRTKVQPESLVPELRRAVQQIDPNLPLGNVRTQQEQIESVTQQERLFVTLTSGFGLLALALASVGIYGVMAYSVAQRTNEIGIRLALGARPAQVQTMVLSESSLIAIAGVVCGLGAALILVRLVKSMLYGISAYDPVTLGSTVLLLLLVATGASWLPARRAAAIQPTEALRHD